MPYCKALYNHVYISLTGELTTCCRAEPTQRFYFKDITINEFRNSNYLNEIRTAMQTGWHPNCEQCKRVEDIGLVSTREKHNTIFSKGNEGDLTFIDMSLNNQCNLSCRMCNDTLSSSWSKITGSYNSVQFDALDQIDWTKVKRIKYTGGEPFVTKEIKHIIDIAAENNIILHFNTNCTFFPEKYIDKLLSAKKVYMALSIDGFNKIAEYIRHGTNWKTTNSIIERWLSYKDQITFNINTVVQAYNIHCLSEVHEFANKNNLIINAEPIQNPSYFSLNALPVEYVDAITDDVNQHYFKNYNFDNDAFEKLKLQTQSMDKLLGKSLQSVNPLLASYLDK